MALYRWMGETAKAERIPSRSPMTEPIPRIRIELQSIEPHVWRRVDVPVSSTLLALHGIIQIAMGWADAHLFEFTVGGRGWGGRQAKHASHERQSVTLAGDRWTN